MMFDKRLSMKRVESKPRPSLPINLQTGSQTVSKKWEFASEIESKSYFKCCFNRLHQDEEVSDGNEDGFAIKNPKEKPYKINGCPACKVQVNQKSKLEKKKVVEDPAWFEGLTDMPFHKLIKELVTKPKENTKEKMIQGCEVFLPDTLFFENMAPSFWIQNDKEGTLVRWNEDKPLPNINDLLQKIDKETKKRKQRKSDMFWAEKERKARKL